MSEISNRYDNLRIPVAASEREKGNIPYYGANGIQDYVKGFTHNGEFVLIAEDGANDLKNYPVKYVNGLFWANNHVHVVQGKESICNNKYLKYCFSKTNIESLLVGGGRAKLNANIMMDIDLKLPKINEQEQIGELFTNIDNLITLHQRKYKLINFVNFFIEIIEFKKWTITWEQRKLGKLMDITSVKRIHQSDWTNSGVRFFRARDIVAEFKNEQIDDKLYISNDKYEEYSLISGKVKINDLIVTGVGTIGIPYLIRNNEPLYFKDGNIIWFKNNNKIDGNFLYYSFIGNKIQTFINEKAGVGTVGTYTIQSGKETPIMLPNSEEQTNVSSLMANIDNLITLHQRKYMFKKHSWEQRKFEKIFNYERPDKYIVESTEYLEFGPTPVLTANKAFILGYTNEKKLYLNSKDSIIFDDFTLDAKFVDFPYMVKSSAIKILTVKDENTDNLRFNYDLLSQHKFNMLGHARHYISVVQPEEAYTTNKAEQDKIATLMANIDNLITLHQH